MSHAAITSILQVVAVTGVTVVSEENHRFLPFFSATIVSYRRLGSTKSIVVTGFPSSFHGGFLYTGNAAFLSGNVIAGQQNVGKALALGMVVIIAVLMIAYVLFQRRSAKWLR